MKVLVNINIGFNLIYFQLPGSYKSKTYFSLKFEDRILNIDLNRKKLLPKSFSVISYKTDDRPEVYSLSDDVSF